MAASLQITPIRVDLPADAGAASLTLRNHGTTPIHAQVRVFRWTQKNNDDVLTPATEVVASPPIMRIEPQSDQMVRVVRPGAQKVESEMAYRLLIDELPAENQAARSGVRLQLRYSVPVFVAANDNVGVPKVAFSLWREGDAWMLGAHNPGAHYAQITQVTLLAGAASMPLSAGLLGYALGNSSRVWKLTLPDGFTLEPGTRLKVTLNGTEVIQPLELARPGVFDVAQSEGK